jgi:predicted nucleic acid-binding protein
MAQTKLLIDSTSYFRLAQNIHPLLATPFGKQAYTLYAHEALVREFSRERRLQTKFHWFGEACYVENRARPLQVGRKEKAAIEQTFEYLWAQVQAEQLGPSPVDTRALATALELGLRLVTDDADLIALAKTYGVATLTSLQLMRLMLDEAHITMDKVRQVVAQWRYDRDTPGGFPAEYIARFRENPPKE